MNPKQPLSKATGHETIVPCLRLKYCKACSHRYLHIAITLNTCCQRTKPLEMSGFVLDNTVCALCHHCGHGVGDGVDVVVVQTSDAHAARFDHVDGVFFAQTIDLSRAQTRVAEHAKLGEQV